MNLGISFRTTKEKVNMLYDILDLRSSFSLDSDASVSLTKLAISLTEDILEDISNERPF